MSDSSLDSGAQQPASAAGYLDFPCRSCGRQLRVRADLAGRRAKCPQCATIQEIPAQVAAPRTLPPGSPFPPAPDSSGPLSGAPTGTGAVLGGAGLASSDVLSPSGALGGAGAADLPLSPAVSRPPAPGPASPFAGTPPVPQATAAVPPTRLGVSYVAYSGRTTPTKELFDRITAEIGKIYVGQEELVLGTLVALFSSGHVLIESVPGLGKTLFVRTMGRALGCDFGRIQFTADLMPSDITGAPIFDMKMQEFRFRPGPVFTQFLLADEINRSPAKTHAALLEIMQEYRVTVDGKSHELKRPFLVLATQNPIESEGTYNLPEAQLDRFMFKLIADYPPAGEEAKILELHSRQIDLNERLQTDVQPVTSPDEIMRITRDNAGIRIDPRLIEYINSLVRLTRKWPHFHMGASPRAGIALMQGARTLAAFAGRDYAIPDDVVQLALPALRHRVILTAEAEVEGRRVDELLTELVRSVEVPRM